MLNDLVVADRADAPRVAESSCPSEEFGGLDAKGIDGVKLSHLHALVTSTKADPNLMPIVAEASEDGPWVQELPVELVRRLAISNDGDLSAMAPRWREAAFDPRWHTVTDDDVREILTEIASLCRRAAAEAKSVLLWTCL